MLGAFIAFTLRGRNDAPSSVLRYGGPALIFVVYNFIEGARAPGVDNAAHAGGVTAGFLLGLILARPLDTRSRFPIGRGLAALLLCGLCALPPLWYLDAFERHPAAFEEFAQAHRWYMDGEGPNILEWQTIGGQIETGTISNDDAIAKFERDIIPFWRDADARFRRELQQPGHGGNPFLPHLANFARLRLAWAQATVAALRQRTPQNVQIVMRDAQQAQTELAVLGRLQLLSQAENLPAPLAESPVAAWIRTRIPALQRPCVEPPPAVQPRPSALDAPDDGPAQRRAMGCLAQRLFMAGDYATLDATMKDDVRHLADLPDGSSRLEGLWGGLENLFEYNPTTIQDTLRRTAEWRRTVKGTAEPAIAEADVFRSWAFDARGHAIASSVTPQAMQIFLMRSAMASAALQEAPPAARNDPMWYVLALGTDRDQAVPADRQRATFDAGAARFPAFLPLYSQMLDSLMPRWGGSTQAVEHFIRDVATKNGTLDSATYARLYLIYANLEGQDFSVVESANANAPTLKQGVAALRNRYARSDYILNSVARFDCITNDVPAYQALRPALRGHASATAWTGTLTIATCDQYR